MKTNEKTKKNGILKVIILVILIIAVVILAGFAYARYMTTKSGQTEVEIAKWNFKVTAGSSQNLSIDLADTRLANDTTEVDSSKVAPGTKGALALNINATGTQVSLEYDIDISLTRIPENLIFYSDSNMTNAILKENGNIHLDGYFGANDTNKTATKNLYWQWKLETGTTQAEIDSNDLLDSEWMGDEIILDIQATGRQVMENPSTEYTVTFDLNGGKLANHGDSTQVTKQVKYGEAYGTLPTPTREGYTFAGWNGKNLFDIGTTDDYYSYEYADMNVTISDNTITALSLKDAVAFIINEKNKYCSGTYTIHLETDGEANRSLLRLYDNNGNILTGNNLSLQGWTYNTVYRAWWRNGTTNTVTIPSQVAYWKFGMVFLGWQKELEISITNIQIQEGTEYNEYEPYYLTSSTPVTQNKNHTLTAIWIEN